MDIQDGTALETGNGIPRLSYRISEVEAATGMDRATIYRRLNDGSLPARKDGKVTLIDAEDLRNYLRNLPPYKAAKAA